jgi:hypothetical protein
VGPKQIGPIFDFPLNMVLFPGKVFHQDLTFYSTYLIL